MTPMDLIAANGGPVTKTSMGNALEGDWDSF
ncbi:MAG: hypothetical protein JWR51_483 [Devosia sp.]|nr:hypothetical protein [Devosia sp.]